MPSRFLWTALLVSFVSLARAQTAATLPVPGDRFAGGAGAVYGFQYYGRAVNFVYARPTGLHRMGTDFPLTRIPPKGATLVLDARDDDSGRKPKVRIAVNETVLCDGETPFHGLGFSIRRFFIPARALRVGANRLEIENRESAGPAGAPPWFMVAGATLLPGANPPLTRAEREQRAGLDLRDPVGATLLRGAADPTYAQVARHFPPMKRPRELVGVPRHPYDIGIDSLGRLQLGGDISRNDSPAVWIETGDPPAPLWSERAPPARRLLDGSLPIVALSGARQGIAFEQTTLGWSEGFSPETDLFALVRLNLRALPGGTLPETVRLVRRPGGESARFTVRPRDGGGEVCLRIPYLHPERAEPIEPAEFARTLAQTRRFWTGLLGRGMQIEVPERRVNAAWKTWLAYSFLDIDRKDGFDEPHDGSGYYGVIYGYSALLYCHALDRYGFHEQAARCLETILHFQQPDGLYTQNYGLPDQGLLLLVLSEHFRLSGDRAWLQRVAPAMERAGDWLLRQRAAAPKTGPVAGLIRFRPYCDYETPTCNFNSDAACCVGLEAAAATLARAGKKPSAQRFRAAAAQYRADILRAMDAATQRRDGGTLLPLEPDTLRLEKASGFRGGEYYGLLASCLLESEFLAADDRRARGIADWIEKRGGLIAGLCRFDNGIDHAYTYGYLLTRLKQGDARRYLLGFYGMLAYGMTRDTFSGVELTQIRTGENAYTLPHLYSCTQQLQTLRTMLLREDGETLRLGEAVPRAWLADGKRVAVTGAPTRFGTVSYTIRSNTKAGRIEVRLAAPPGKPAQIVLHLRHPEGWPPRRVVVNGRRLRAAPGETIVLERPQGDLRIEAQYAPPGHPR